MKFSNESAVQLFIQTGQEDAQASRFLLSDLSAQPTVNNICSVH